MVDQSGLGQGWVNQGQWAKPGLPHVFINKVLLEPSHARWFAYHLCLLWITAAEGSNCDRDDTACLTICPLTESVCQGQTFLLNHPT